MAKSLPRKVKVGFRLAMASQPFHVVVIFADIYYVGEMEKEEEKDDPTNETAPQANPGIFMRLKSNILNRLQNAKMYLDNERNTDRIYNQIEIHPP